MAETARNILSSTLNRIQFQSHFNIISSRLSAFISTQFTSSLTASVFYFTRIRFINSFNETIALTIPTLANLVQLKISDPFSTHPKTMRVAVSSTILFYLTYTALLRFPLRRRFAVIADHCLLSIGNASVASLSSVLLPDSYSPFIFALFGLLSVVEFLYWLYDELVTDDGDEEFDVRRMRVSEFFNNVWAAFGNITGQPQPILPL